MDIKRKLRTPPTPIPCHNFIFVFSGFSGVEEGGSPDSGASGESAKLVDLKVYCHYIFSVIGESAKLADLKVFIIYSMLVENPLNKQMSRYSSNIHC